MARLSATGMAGVVPYTDAELESTKRFAPALRAASSMLSVLLQVSAWHCRGSRRLSGTLLMAARWQTASAPSHSPSASRPTSRRRYSKFACCNAPCRLAQSPGWWRSTPRTRLPSASSASHRWLPMKPAAPVTTTS
ncbi:MAG: hypothetical protein M5U25_11085 [Planctomycetota bacterium]|nr:hypothetical protein [Planctomycetota bacterium]